MMAGASCKRRKPGRPRKKRPSEPQTADAFLVSGRHFLPDLAGWMARVRDPRKRLNACTYSMKDILMLAVMMLCAQCGSRKQLDRDTANVQFLSNFQAMVGDDYEMEHGYGIKKNAWSRCAKTRQTQTPAPTRGVGTDQTG